MATKPPIAPVEMRLKVLPPDESTLPPAVFSNYVFVNRQDDEITLIFAHAHGPLGLSLSAEDKKRVEVEGVRPTLVSLVVLPKATVKGLVEALSRIVGDELAPDEGAVP